MRHRHRAAARQLLGRRATRRRPVRASITATASRTTPAAAPDVVCFPHTTDEVAAIVAISAAHQVPIVPFGAGTSLEGHVHAIRGGITIDLREMNRDPPRQRRGPRRDGRGRRDAAAAAQGAAQHRADVFGRSRRRRDHRRHGGDARVGHDRRALRHDARERAGPDGRARRRPRDHDRHARAQVVGRATTSRGCSSDPKARSA